MQAWELTLKNKVLLVDTELALIHAFRSGMVDSIRITAAGNVEVPSFLVLRDLGFTVSCEWGSKGQEVEIWIAEREDLKLSANGPLELLGLLKLLEQRGQEWQASDAEIDAFLLQFYPEEASGE